MEAVRSVLFAFLLMVSKKYAEVNCLAVDGEPCEIGTYSPYPYDCNGYYYCPSGTWVKTNCQPHTRVFNPNTAQCVGHTQYYCVPSTSAIPSTTTEPLIITTTTLPKYKSTVFEETTQTTTMTTAAGSTREQDITTDDLPASTTEPQITSETYWTTERMNETTNSSLTDAAISTTETMFLTTDSDNTTSSPLNLETRRSTSSSTTTVPSKTPQVESRSTHEPSHSTTARSVLTEVIQQEEISTNAPYTVTTTGTRFSSSNIYDSTSGSDFTELDTYHSTSSLGPTMTTNTLQVTTSAASPDQLCLNNPKEWNLTMQEVEELLDAIKQYLYIHPKSTSAYKRTLHSWPDHRTSCATLGVAGVLFCVSAIVFIVLSDVGSCAISKEHDNDRSGL